MKTIVRMKDGRVFEGKLCQWDPAKGFIAVEGASGKPEDRTHISLDGVESARTGEQDELARARDAGWRSAPLPAPMFGLRHTANDFK